MADNPLPLFTKDVPNGGTASINKKDITPDDSNRARVNEDHVTGVATGQMSSDQAKKFLKTSIDHIAQATKGSEAGSTFSAAVVTNDGKIVTAHLGDSPVYAVIVGKDGKASAQRLTRDHDVNNEAEVKRIREDLGKRPGWTAVQPPAETCENFTGPNGELYKIKVGRQVVMKEVDGQVHQVRLDTARGFGDSAFEGIQSRTPEIQVHDLKLKPGERLFIVAGSDGLSKGKPPLTPQEIADTVANNQNKPGAAAEQLVRGAASKRAVDDLTAVVVEAKPGTAIAVADGHGGADVARKAIATFDRHADYPRLIGIPVDAPVLAVNPLAKDSTPKGKPVGDVNPSNGPSTPELEKTLKALIKQRIDTKGGIYTYDTNKGPSLVLTSSFSGNLTVWRPRSEPTAAGP